MNGRLLASNDTHGLYEAMSRQVQGSNIDAELDMLRREAEIKARDPT